MSSERPIKRIRQACMPCRRKKTKCPGEKPVCGHCERLRQPCSYGDDLDDHRMTADGYRQSMEGRQEDAINMEERLRLVEAQLANVVAGQSPIGVSVPGSSQTPATPSSLRQHSLSRTSNAHLPPSSVAIVASGEAYLQYFDCQPLPLFDRKGFLDSLPHRDPEVLYALRALTSRFVDFSLYHDSGQLSQNAMLERDVEAARSIVSQKVFDGAIEFSTLQALCILSLVDFTNGNVKRASVSRSLAMSLVHNAGLTQESTATLLPAAREERRRLFWSLFLLKRLHSADFSVQDVPREETFPWYPASKRLPNNAVDMLPGPSTLPNNDQDKGIVAYTIQLSEIWFQITRYARRRGNPNGLPPWDSASEYSIAMTKQMEFETRMPYHYRFKPAQFSHRSSEDLGADRDYWGPWLFLQFLYHTNLCLLNHPLLLSLRLRNFKCMIPEVFLQHTSDLISSHASWIIRFVEMLEAKSFKVSDPFLAHCVAIVATIYLQESFTSSPTLRVEKRHNFEICLRFIRNFEEWPHIMRMAGKLEKLSSTVISAYPSMDGSPQAPAKSVLIDLGQFWEVLEYSSSSEKVTRSSGLFGESLQEQGKRKDKEMAHASALPEPTRVDRQDFDGRGALGQTPGGRMTPGGTGLVGSGSPAGYGVGDAAGMQIFSEDELAVLAENFFQRPDAGGGEEWWNVGNL